MLVQHLIEQREVKHPTPRIKKKFGNILNISSYIFQLNQMDPTMCQNFLQQTFDEGDWQEDCDHVNNFTRFREAKIDDDVVKRQKPFKFTE